MALILIDHNKTRAQSIREHLRHTPIGLNIESFKKAQEAVLWARVNPTSLLIVDQKVVEDEDELKSFKKLSMDVPVLVMKNDHEQLLVDFNSRIH